jgi:hypothetical protein
MRLPSKSRAKERTKNRKSSPWISGGSAEKSDSRKGENIASKQTAPISEKPILRKPSMIRNPPAIKTSIQASCGKKQIRRLNTVSLHHYAVSKGLMKPI